MLSRMLNGRSKSVENLTPTRKKKDTTFRETSQVKPPMKNTEIKLKEFSTPMLVEELSISEDELGNSTDTITVSNTYTPGRPIIESNEKELSEYGDTPQRSLDDVYSRLERMSAEMKDLKLENKSLREHIDHLYDQMKIIPTNICVRRRGNEFFLQWENKFDAQFNVAGYQVKISGSVFNVKAQNCRVIILNPVEGAPVTLQAISRNGKPMPEVEYRIVLPSDEDKENTSIV